MRRSLKLLCIVLLLLGLCIPVSAEPAANHIGSYITVTNDGSCDVTLTLNLHLEQAQEKLQFPLPKQASRITVNGSWVSTQSSGDVKLVNLSGVLKGLVGDCTVTLNYSVSDLVHTTEAGLLELQLPLLSGFEYPVKALEFSISFPGELTARPAFSSGYHQATIEEALAFAVSGATITGSSKEPMKDHETLVMTLPVTEEMFPQTAIELPDFDVCNTAMAVCAVLALLYWLFTMRNLPPRRLVQSAPPEGCSAGELGTILSLQGVSLSILVLFWAQLGYLQLRRDNRGHVVLYRLMDMGNERNGFEQRCFRTLFGRRQWVDTTSLPYAQLSRAMAKTVPNTQALLHPHSGNPKLFQALVALIGLFSGINLGLTLGAEAALQWLLIVLLAALGFLTSFSMQQWAACLFLRNKRPLYIALALGAIWMILGFAAGVPQVAGWFLLGQGIAGLMLAYGGRRTEAGRQMMAEVLGLRRYLRTRSTEQMRQICQNNPYYFHTMAPYAQALGVGKSFAKAFGSMPVPACPYLAVREDDTLTAARWNDILNQTLHDMDARANHLSTERLFGFLRYISGRP